MGPPRARVAGRARYVLGVIACGLMTGTGILESSVGGSKTVATMRIGGALEEGILSARKVIPAISAPSVTVAISK